LLTADQDSAIPYIWDECKEYGPGTEPGTIWGYKKPINSFGQMGCLRIFAFFELVRRQMLRSFARLPQKDKVGSNTVIAGGLGGLIGLGAAFSPLIREITSRKTRI